LHGLGADGNALLSFQLFPDLGRFEPGVGHAVAEFTALASADNADPALDDTETEGGNGAEPRPAY
jgi:hypothetical protein